MQKLWHFSKLLINILKFQIPTATKITSNYPFRMRLAPVSLQYDIPFSKNIGLASVLQQPFRTGSKHPKKRVAPHIGLGTNTGNVTKKHNRQSFEPSLGVQRVATLWATFGSFRRSEKNVKTFPSGNFLTSRKFAPVGAARCACYEASRFCKPRSSAASRHFPGRRGAAPYPVHAKRVQIHHTSRA